MSLIFGHISYSVAFGRKQTDELLDLTKPFKEPFLFWVNLMADIRIQLTDKDIFRLPLAKKGAYLVRDTDLKGFFIVVGKRKKTFAV